MDNRAERVGATVPGAAARTAAIAMRSRPRQDTPPVRRPAAGTTRPEPAPGLVPVHVAAKRGGWLDRPLSGRAAADLAVNERARGEGTRAVQRDARTAEYDWYETQATPTSAGYVAAQADQEHATAEVYGDLAAFHESNASALAAQGYPVDTRQALAARRGRAANTAGRGPALAARTRPVPTR